MRWSYATKSPSAEPSARAATRWTASRDRNDGGCSSPACWRRWGVSVTRSMPASRACACGMAVGASRRTARITSVVAIPLEATRAFGREPRKRRSAGVSASVITSFTRAEESAYTTLPLISAQITQRVRQRTPRQWRQRVDFGTPPIADGNLTFGDHAFVRVRGLDRHDPSYRPSAIGDLDGLASHHASDHAARVLLQLSDAHPHRHIVEQPEAHRCLHAKEPRWKRTQRLTIP